MIHNRPMDAKDIKLIKDTAAWIINHKDYCIRWMDSPDDVGSRYKLCMFIYKYSDAFALYGITGDTFEIYYNNKLITATSA